MSNFAFENDDNQQFGGYGRQSQQNYLQDPNRRNIEMLKRIFDEERHDGDDLYSNEDLHSFGPMLPPIRNSASALNSAATSLFKDDVDELPPFATLPDVVHPTSSHYQQAQGKQVQPMSRSTQKKQLLQQQQAMATPSSSQDEVGPQLDSGSKKKKRRQQSKGREPKSRRRQPEKQTPQKDSKEIAAIVECLQEMSTFKILDKPLNHRNHHHYHYHNDSDNDSSEDSENYSSEDFYDDDSEDSEQQLVEAIHETENELAQQLEPSTETSRFYNELVKLGETQFGELLQKEENQPSVLPSVVVHQKRTPYLQHLRRGVKRRGIEQVAINNFENSLHLVHSDPEDSEVEGYEDEGEHFIVDQIAVKGPPKGSDFELPCNIDGDSFVLTNIDVPHLRKRQKRYHELKELLQFTMDSPFQKIDPSQQLKYCNQEVSLHHTRTHKPHEFVDIFERVMLESLHFKPTMDEQEFVQTAYSELSDLRSAHERLAYAREQERDSELKIKWNKVVSQIPREHKQYLVRQSSHHKISARMAARCQLELVTRVKKSVKLAQDVPMRAKGLQKEMVLFWKKYEKELAEKRRRKQKEDVDRKKKEEDMEEAKRQQRKLNFLLTQTELYSHFVGKKMRNIDDQTLPSTLTDKSQEEAEAEGLTKERAIQIAERAAHEQLKSLREFDKEIEKFRRVPISEIGNQVSFSDPVDNQELIRAPSIFKGSLKKYQLKGFSWLVSLYDQGINGILADEMGLGKTVQTICFLSHLAEEKGIWGPFLVIAPSSTLHNWQQEFAKFCPTLKVVPYWGGPKERKLLRKNWKPNNLYNQDSAFHVCITSYGLILEDEKLFHKIKWQYLILDEAHAIKSSKSSRWNALLKFKCRNRMLLTGTPIQNNMAELWALLHFIMPSLFDSHDEFSEWFARDIESHAEEKGTLNQQQLTRLHMILKPFMLRRVKKDVESEMPSKIENVIYCNLSSRQKQMYKIFKDQFSKQPNVDNLLTSEQISTTKSLMNFVMQFRKVCNHPHLFQAEEVSSPFHFVHPQPATKILPPEILGYIPVVRTVNRNLIELNIPKFMYRNGLVGLGSVTDQCGDIDNQMRHKLLFNTLNIFNPDYIADSVFPWRSHHTGTNEKHKSTYVTNSTFSFLRFSDMTPSELCFLAKADLFERFVAQTNLHKRLDRLHYISNWNREENQSVPKVCKKTAMFLLEELFRATCHAHISSSALDESSQLMWRDLVQDDPAVLYTNHRLLLKRVYCFKHKVSAPPIQLYCPDRSYMFQQRDSTFSNWQKYICLKQPFTVPASPSWKDKQLVKFQSYSVSPIDRREILVGNKDAAWERDRTGLVVPYLSIFGSSKIWLPSLSKMIADSGKLQVLEKLLQKLKREGHRVLIFSQMTKMLDILEDFMHRRHYKFLRLDGHTTVADRRDMVHAFQTRDDIFIFLLSTRAGGLGITLTAADTVIFYDNDWNPTLDAQAMDRVHRIGQTKQVTVYRLVIKGTVEDRILKIAQQKSTIQNTVYSGQFKADTDEVTRSEVVSLLLDDLELDRMQIRKQQLQQQQQRRASAAAKAAWNKKHESSKPKAPTKRKKKVAPRTNPVVGVADSSASTLQPATIAVNGVATGTVDPAAASVVALPNAPIPTNKPKKRKGSDKTKANSEPKKKRSKKE